MVDEKIVKSLQSKNIMVRRQAIMRLAKIGDESAIKPLAMVYKSDPDGDIRELAKESAKEIRSRMRLRELERVEQPVDAPEARPQRAYDPANELRGAAKAEVRRRATERRESINLWLVGAIALFIGGGALLWVLFGTAITRIFDQTQAEMTVDQALPFVDGQHDITANLEGKIYKGTLSNGSNFILIEPKGIAPSVGWTAVVAISSGNAQDAIGSLRRRAAEDNVLLVAPDFAVDAGSPINTSNATADIQILIQLLKKNYPLNPATTTLYGSGIGADFASQYVAGYPRDFALASLSNALTYQTPSNTTPVQFLLFAGQLDADRANAVIQFKLKLDSMSRTVAYFEVINGLGNAETARQAEMTFGYLKTLLSAN